MFSKPNKLSVVFKLIGCLLASITMSCAAEIITDGSLGAKVELSGKNFQITPELGQQLGSNLFHSFQSFNLNLDESATFSGTDSVQNVIARVTGGSPSQINGLMRSTIPNADLYFINPYGVMFGQNAKLDLQGGFHVSTADYLKLQDGGRFDARNPNNSLLSVAPIAAFGFLTDSPAPITTQDSRLSVPETKSLSLVGGRLQLLGSSPIQFDKENIYALSASSLLKTNRGRLNLVAAKSGEVLLNDEVNLTGLGEEINLDHTLVDSSGNLKIRGSRLLMQDSTLQMNRLEGLDGEMVDIQLTEFLRASNTTYYFVSFNSKALYGNAGQIRIKSPELTLDKVLLATNTLSAANAGDIDIEVAQLNLLNGSGITASSIGQGKGGQISINANQSILLSGHSVGSQLYNGLLVIDIPSFIDDTTYYNMSDSTGSGHISITTPKLTIVSGIISSASLGKGDAGNIIIRTDQLSITEGGYITASALNTGAAGNIELDVADTLFLSGIREGIYTTGNIQYENVQSNISSVSLSGSGGHIQINAKAIHLNDNAVISTSSLGFTGEKNDNLNIQADSLLLTTGGQINSSNGIYSGTNFMRGNGIGGNIHIHAKQIMLDGQEQYQRATGIFSDTFNQAQGGNIEIRTNELNIQRSAAISARSYDLGNAGQINLQASQVSLTQLGNISTAAAKAGGGNIQLNLHDFIGLIYLDNSEITTSVATGQGSGGDIIIERPQFIILNQAQIKAQADTGHGGNISIVAQHFVPSFDSLISASSNLGIDGQITISSPTEDVGNQVLSLSANFLNAAALLPLSCAARIADQRPSEFTRPFTLVLKPHVLSDVPEDVRPSYISQLKQIKN